MANPATGTSSPIQVTVTNGQTYRVSIRAHNINGLGASYLFATPVTPTGGFSYAGPATYAGPSVYAGE